MLDEVVDRIESTVVALARQGNDFLRESELDVRIAEVKRRTEQVVCNHPVESVIVGAIVGFFIGRILFRNK